MKGIRGFLNGMTAFQRGFSLILKHPRLLPLVVIPFIINAILYSILIYFCLTEFSTWLESFSAARTEWWWVWTGAKYISHAMFYLFLLVACYFSFVPIGTVVTAPFNEILTHKVESIQLQDAHAISGGVKGFAVDIWLAISHAIIRAVIFLLLRLIVMPLLFIPIVGPIIIVYIEGRYLAWDGLDYCLARRRLSFREKSAYLASHRAPTLGLGVVGYFLFLIPFTALFIFPFLAVSGTVLFCEMEEKI